MQKINLTKSFRFVALVLALAVGPFVSSAAQKVSSPLNLIPQETIAKLLERYNGEERELIALDLASIRKLVFAQRKPARGRKPIYLATAGAPGARKSTILEYALANDTRYSNTVYVDPDQRALRFMAASYLASSLSNYAISRAASYEDVQRKAYDHWRDASNYIANTLLNEAFAGGFDIAHGTTMTGPFAGALLKKLKEAGYEVVLMLCGAEDHMRGQAVTHRSTTQAFYQVTAADVISKGLLFPQRMPVYFAHADRLSLHWSGELKAPLSSAAELTRGEALRIFNADDLALFVAQYETDRRKDPALPPWTELLNSMQNR